MNRFSSALAISFSLLVLVGVGVILTNDPEAPDAGVRHAELDLLRVRFDELQRRLDSLPAAPSVQPAAASGTSTASDDASISEEKAEHAEGDDSSSAEDALLARVATIETRLRGLEEDPIHRAFTYLQSENADLRKRGVYSLETLARSDPEARAAIREMLNDADAGVRIAALDTLADIDDKDIAPLVAGLLADDNSDVRREAINTLTRLRAKDSAADIAAFIGDEDRKVRELAVDSMGKLGHGASAGALLSALGDESARVRGEAISSLGEVGATESLPRLRDIYKTQADGSALGESDHRVRLAQAMKQLGDPTAAHVEFSRLGGIIMSGANERSRSGAMRALLWIGRGDPGARTIFQQLSKHQTEWIRREAQRALQGGQEKRE